MDVDITDDEARDKIAAMIATAPRPALIWALLTLPTVIDQTRPLADVIANAGQAARLYPWSNALDEADEADDEAADAGMAAVYAMAVERNDPAITLVMRTAAAAAAVCLDIKRADDIRRAGGTYDPYAQPPLPPWAPDDEPPPTPDTPPA